MGVQLRLQQFANGFPIAGDPAERSTQWRNASSPSFSRASFWATRLLAPKLRRPHLTTIKKRHGAPASNRHRAEALKQVSKGWPEGPCLYHDEDK